MRPLFSIIIPCFNQGEFLKESISSVLNQSFIDFELLIINDGSYDDTEKIARFYVNNDERVKYFHKPNGGLSSARNYGIQLASGKYLNFLDADDLLKPSCLAENVKVIELKSPDLIQMGYEYLAGKSNIILHSVIPSSNFFIPAIFMGSPGPPVSFIIKSEMVKKVSLFDETLKSVEDWDFWIRVAKCNPVVVYLKDVLTTYRLHELSMSRNYFVMYDSFCQVSKRASHFDKRINTDVSNNTNYRFNVKPVLKNALIRFTALAIMQGKIEEALELFKRETAKNQYQWRAEEFREMNNYLTFRYRYSDKDMEWVFQEQWPLFQAFFKNLSFNKLMIRRSIENVFIYHLKMHNRKRYGLIGTFFNKASFFPTYKLVKFD